jgi:ABC-type polysaccharide/polyol phosphate export permease
VGLSGTSIQKVLLVSQVRRVNESRELVWNLCLRELRAKYRRSFLGWTWSLLNPLTVVLTYGFVFGVVLGSTAPLGNPSGLQNFALYLLTGVLPWGFFTLTTGQGLIAVSSNAGLVRKVAFPREALVFAQSLFCLVQHAIEILVLNVVMLAFGVNVLPHLPVTVFLVVMNATFATGIGFLLAPTTVYFRDLPYLWQVMTQIYFFMTPIIYTPDAIKDKVPDAVDFVLTWNPMAVVVRGFRHTLYDGEVPPASTFWYLPLVSIGVLALGMSVFKRLDRRIAEEL